MSERLATAQASLRVEAPPPATPPPVRVASESSVKLADLFDWMMAHEGSDLHLSSGLPPNVRVHGDIQTTGFPVLQDEDIRALMFATMTDADRQAFMASGDVDYSIEQPGVARFRVNCMEQYRGMAAVLRVIPHKVPLLAGMGMPDVITEIAHFKKGLILVTGPTGSGKSTTMAAIINEINETRNAHIITIEDPLEFVHPSKSCLVTHREIGRDANSFSDALRAAIREDPDIVLVGEMRDLDTVAQAIKAAEMGLLVLGTLHTNSAAKAIDRVIDIFPVNQQDQIRTMLSDSLRAVVAQQLLKRGDGKGRVPVQEILLSTPGLGNMIREGKTHQIASVIQTGRDVGMQSMDQALIDLVQRNLITPAAAKERASDLRAFQRAGIVFDEAAG
ncbi:MAG: type IV pilus twitching motility protein PilT [Armatimonadetes bacterium]|nr:type IV pilus twitching motility protein PilT [Armatimonadota bacterium]